MGGILRDNFRTTRQPSYFLGHHLHQTKTVEIHSQTRGAVGAPSPKGIAANHGKFAENFMQSRVSRDAVNKW
jgi:hypothetical protein